MKNFPQKLNFLFVALVLIGVYFFWKSNQEKYLWTAFGETPGDSFGSKVVGAGDVNGDGFADAAVWASDFNFTTGKVYLYLGSARGLSKTAAWTNQGEARGNGYGHSFGSIGDVNGDGFGDFIVAAQGYSNPLTPGIGKAYVYLGAKEGLNPKPIWTHLGHASEELFGDCSGRAGDINQDGWDDVLIGAYGFKSFRGAAYVYYGSQKDGLSAKPAWRGEGEAAGDWYGYSVSSAGDVNHDGFADLIIGAKQVAKENLRHVGKAYVYYGSKTGLPPQPSWSAAGENQQDLFGWRAIKAGDVNGDGFDDVLIAAYSHSSKEASSLGKVYVYLGGPQGLAKDPAWTHDGEMAGALFGTSIASGDFNKDGFSDVVVGSSHFRPAGKIYLFLGNAKGLPSSPSDTVTGENEGDNFGTYVANAGDVNGDGYADILTGAPNNAEKGYRAGKVYLFYGGKNGKLNRTP